ncbi:MAG: hypothetical protein ABSE48_06585 [Verrucomicrobiota bacterium]
MKPCESNRKLIVWHALNALGAQETRQLLAHFEICEGCRHYLAEISTVADGLAVVKINPDVQASESFHRNVAQKLRTAKPDSLGEILAAYIQGSQLNWRVAVPVVVVLAFVGVILSTRPQPPKHAAPLSVAPLMVPASGPEIDEAPTIANYQRSAEQSMENLDALLTQQSRRVPPILPSYTASTHSLAGESF